MIFLHMEEVFCSSQWASEKVFLTPSRYLIWETRTVPLCKSMPRLSTSTMLLHLLVMLHLILDARQLQNIVILSWSTWEISICFLPTVLLTPSHNNLIDQKLFLISAHLFFYVGTHHDMYAEIYFLHLHHHHLRPGNLHLRYRYILSLAPLITP